MMPRSLAAGVNIWSRIRLPPPLLLVLFFSPSFVSLSFRLLIKVKITKIKAFMVELEMDIDPDKIHI